MQAKEGAAPLEARSWSCDVVECAAVKSPPLTRANGGKTPGGGDDRTINWRPSLKSH